MYFQIRSHQYLAQWNYFPTSARSALIFLHGCITLVTQNHHVIDQYTEALLLPSLWLTAEILVISPSVHDPGIL